MLKPKTIANIVKMLSSKNIKKKNFAIFEVPDSIPLNPSNPATRDITKNINA